MILDSLLEVKRIMPYQKKKPIQAICSGWKNSSKFELNKKIGLVFKIFYFL
jgi:hypothetical protein